jgi:hypothetical protein
MILKEILDDNLNGKNQSFLFRLRDEAFFSKSEYNKIVYAVHECNLSIDLEGRTRLSCVLWEFLFLVLVSICADSDDNDAFNISGLEPNEKSDVANKLYWLGNCFAWKKDFNIAEVLI